MGLGFKVRFVYLILTILHPGYPAPLKMLGIWCWEFSITRSSRTVNINCMEDSSKVRRGVWFKQEPWN